jgi:recombination protein RecT
MNKPNEIAVFNGFLDKLKPQMALALPKHLSSDRIARLALTQFSTNKALQKCTQQSIAASIMTAVQLGLEPGVNGAGYLIPYKDTCTFVPGWKGLVDLVNRSGRGTVYTGVIFEDQIYGQDWEFFDGSRRELIIRKQSNLIDENKITHAYAIGWVKDASMPIIELWTVEKLKAHRNKQNKIGNNHYSFKYWEMYCRKIPLLQVIKYMPCSIELAMALDVSNVNEHGGNASIIDGVVATQYQDDIDDTLYDSIDDYEQIKKIKPRTESEKASHQKRLDELYKAPEADNFDAETGEVWE